MKSDSDSVDGPSNKPPLSPLLKPLQTKVFIDYFSATVSVPDKCEREQIYANLLDARKSILEGWPGGTLLHGMGYPVGVRFLAPDPNGHFTPNGISIQARAPSYGKGFVRVQWNPARLSPAQTFDVAQHIDQMVLPGWRARVRQSGSVTRIDTTSDFLGIPMDEIMIHVDKKQTFGLFTGPGGRTQTMYFGKGGSNQVQVYDRTVKNIAEAKGVDPKPNSKHWVRIEVRHKPGKTGPFPVGDLPSLGNPFAPIRIYHPDWKHPELQHAMFRLFASAWQARGRKRAMELAGPEGETLRALTERCRARWWNSEAKWKHWLQALEKAGLLVGPDTAGT